MPESSRRESFEFELNAQDVTLAQSLPLPGNQLEDTRIPFYCEVLLVLSGVPASRSSHYRNCAYCIGVISVSWHIGRNIEKFSSWTWEDLYHPSWSSRTPISVISKVMHGVFALSIAWRIRDSLRLDPKSYKVLHYYSFFLLIGWTILRILELVLEIKTGRNKWWELVQVICPGLFHEVPRMATILLFALACETLQTRKRQFLAAVAASATSTEVNTYYHKFEQQVLNVSRRFELFVALALVLELLYFVSLLLMRPETRTEGTHIVFVMVKVLGTFILFLWPAAQYNTSIFFAAEKFASGCLEEKSLVEGPNVTACTLLLAKPAYFRIAYVWNPTVPKLILVPTSLILTRLFVPWLMGYIRVTSTDFQSANTTLTTTG